MKFNDIKLPDLLDETIARGIEEGKIARKKRDKMNKTLWGGISSFVALIVAFGMSVNIFPSFADSLKSVPVVGVLVNLFQLSDETVEGGVITDGANVSWIALNQNETEELLTITVDSDTDEMSRYTAKHELFPNTVTFTMPGARALDAKKLFDQISAESNFIITTYEIMTLDDSMVRFAIQLEKDATVTLSEYKKPNQLVITMQEVDEPVKTIFSLRTESYESTMDLAYLEERLMINDIQSRYLQDDQGTQFIEIGQFESEIEASEFLNKMKTAHSDLEGTLLFVEARTGNNTPTQYLAGTQAVKEKIFLDEYMKILQSATTLNDIVSYATEHESTLTDVEREYVIKGINGYIDGYESYAYQIIQMGTKEEIEQLIQEAPENGVFIEKTATGYDVKIDETVVKAFEKNSN